MGHDGWDRWHSCDSSRHGTSDAVLGCGVGRGWSRLYLCAPRAADQTGAHHCPAVCKPIRRRMRKSAIQTRPVSQGIELPSPSYCMGCHLRHGMASYITHHPHRPHHRKQRTPDPVQDLNPPRERAVYSSEGSLSREWDSVEWKEKWSEGWREGWREG